MFHSVYPFAPTEIHVFNVFYAYARSAIIISLFFVYCLSDIFFFSLIFFFVCTKAAVRFVLLQFLVHSLNSSLFSHLMRSLFLSSFFFAPNSLSFSLHHFRIVLFCCSNLSLLFIFSLFTIANSKCVSSLKIDLGY